MQGVVLFLAAGGVLAATTLILVLRHLFDPERLARRLGRRTVL